LKLKFKAEGEGGGRKEEEGKEDRAYLKSNNPNT
jgi:hypothetical protein